MPLTQALANAAWLSLPAAIYAVVQRRRGLRELTQRVGLQAPDQQSVLIALSAAAALSLAVLPIARLTAGFKGSMTARFVGAPLSASLSWEALCYGFVATAVPEELLFRGLIAGALLRRLPFRRANALQAGIFVLPHLLILLMAPRLWPLAIVLPATLGAVAGWLRHRSGSIWPGVLVHGIPNVVGALAVLRW